MKNDQVVLHAEELEHLAAQLRDFAESKELARIPNESVDAQIVQHHLTHSRRHANDLERIISTLNSEGNIQ